MEILAGVAVDHSTWDDKLTTVNDYDDVQCHWPYSSSVRSSYWNCECLGGKTLYFTAATNNLLVKILGSLDEGVTFPVTVESEFLVAVGSPVLKSISLYVNSIKIHVKPAVAGVHGTLSVIGGGSSLPGITDVDVLSSALPTGAATAANQTTGNASLSSIDDKQPALVDAQVPVAAGYKTKIITLSFTCVDATSQYDAVGALVEVPNFASANGRAATIRRIWMELNNNAIAPQFELHFFKASDVTVAADNVTWTSLAAEFAKRAGYIIMPAMAKPSGSGTIDLVRCQSDDYGQALNFQATCDADKTSLWCKPKLLTSGISFAGTPGNTLKVMLEIEQS